MKPNCAFMKRSIIVHGSIAWLTLPLSGRASERELEGAESSARLRLASQLFHGTGQVVEGVVGRLKSGMVTPCLPVGRDEQAGRLLRSPRRITAKNRTIETRDFGASTNVSELDDEASALVGDGDDGLSRYGSRAAHARRARGSQSSAQLSH